MKIKLTQLNPEDTNKKIEKEIYLDSILKSNLDLGMNQLKKDFDQVWFVDGGEGGGKSVLAITCAYYVSPEDRRHNLLDRVVLRIEDAPKIIKSAKPFDSIVLDESYGGMSSTGSMIKLNRMLQRMFTEIRAKNLFIFIVAPSFMDINRYFAIWRSRCLLHIYTTGDERGFCSFFNSELKKRLFILGKKQFYNYGCVQPNFRFRFTSGKDMIDWDAYKDKKRQKNLEDDDDESEVSQSVMKKCWMKVVNNLDKCSKPLTQEQKAQIIEMSRRNICNYARETRCEV